MKHLYCKILLFTSLVFLLGACATYYTKLGKYQTAIESGNFQEADRIISTEKFPKKDQILGDFERGWAQWILHNSVASNLIFTNADSLIDMEKFNFGQQALATFTNESVKTYRPEDFENVFVNYFKSLNYIRLFDYPAARVEARVMNEKLYKLNDKYPNKNKNAYSDDAFAHVIIGLMYEANNEYNDAFIAYRNALQVYEKLYVPEFNIEVPQQLKIDLLRAAYKTGFYDEVRFYEKQFGINYTPEAADKNTGELVILWHNGLCPVKDEVSLNFGTAGGHGIVDGFMNISCPELNLTLPVFVGGYSSGEVNKFSDIGLVRIAFPTYVERKPLYETAVITLNGETLPLSKAESINAIAFKTLQDRMLREIGTTVLRAMVKKASEYGLRQANENVGAIWGLMNALTEKADTRGWQSLPHTISYIRIRLPEGTQTVAFTAFQKNGQSRVDNIPVNIKAGKLNFYSFHTTDCLTVPKKY